MVFTIKNQNGYYVSVHPERRGIYFGKNLKHALLVTEMTKRKAFLFLNQHYKTHSFSLCVFEQQ